MDEFETFLQSAGHAANFVSPSLRSISRFISEKMVSEIRAVRRLTRMQAWRKPVFAWKRPASQNLRFGMFESCFHKQPAKMNIKFMKSIYAKELEKNFVVSLLESSQVLRFSGCSYNTWCENVSRVKSSESFLKGEYHQIISRIKWLTLQESVETASWFLKGPLLGFSARLERCVSAKTQIICHYS